MNIGILGLAHSHVMSWDHAELVKKAAQKKKKIVLYKPMALTLAQADSIAEAAAANGVTAEEGRNALKMVFATYLSNRGGRCVTRAASPLFP
jgi:predicted dehydrogenase